VRNHYVPPQQLGSDRWAALVAARQRHGGACLVVNAGTAMTVDALSPCGAFLGGLIVPGIRLMAESLLRATAEIRIGHGTVQEFPVSTGDAVESGAVLASAACIERTYGKLSERFAEGPLCLLTGGAADLLLPHIRIPLLKADHLVLEGLIAIAGV
jgi:type III pantothenate kinase